MNILTSSREAVRHLCFAQLPIVLALLLSGAQLLSNCAGWENDLCSCTATTGTLIVRKRPENVTVNGPIGVFFELNAPRFWQRRTRRIAITNPAAQQATCEVTKDGLALVATFLDTNDWQKEYLLFNLNSLPAHEFENIFPSDLKIGDTLCTMVDSNMSAAACAVISHRDCAYLRITLQKEYNIQWHVGIFVLDVDLDAKSPVMGELTGNRHLTLAITPKRSGSAYKACLDLTTAGRGFVKFCDNLGE